MACFSAETKNISAEAYALIEAKTETVLEEKNGDKKMAPASTTKILTAIIAIEKAPLTSEFTVSKDAAAVIGSQIGLLEGESLTLQDLLYLLLLKSANDAAVVIAEGIAGNVEDFAVLMNKKAKQIGAVNSNFVNPHGLPDDNHYTTAKDLAIIAAYAMRNEVFASIVSTKTYKTGYHSLTIANSNKLLYQYDYIKGVKTGFTKAAGRCLVSCAEKEGVMLIGVTLNAPNDWEDHIKIYDEGFKRVEATTLFNPYGYKCVRNVLNGQSNATFYNSQSIMGIRIDGKDMYFEYREDIEPLIFAPVRAYSPYGYITQIYNGKDVARVSVYSISDVNTAETQGFFERIIHKIRNLFKNLL
jgi:D-alanyl-D-alanine carboxypeptidase